MAAIERKSFDSPDNEIKLPHGRMRVVLVGDESIWRSELAPGWTWDDDMKPLAGGAASCPLTHREYVVSGRIRYHSDDGTEVTGEAGDYLFIRPGHTGEVLGEDVCVLVDW